MFTRISALLAVAIVASARMERHILVPRDSTMNQCNVGTLSCCNTLSNASSIKPVLDAFSMQYEETDNVGINCTPLNVGGAGESAGCQQQPVCCSNNTYNGFFNVGCSPLDVN